MILAIAGGAGVFLMFMLSAMFSGSETSFTFLDEVTLSRLVREKKISDGDKKLWKRSNEVLTSLLVGNNIVNNVNAVVATLLATYIAELAGLSEQLMVTAFTIGLIVLALIFAEVLPKTFARTHTESVAGVTAFVVKLSLALFRPFSWLLMLITNMVLRNFAKATNKDKNSDSKSAFSSVEDIETVIALGLKEGIIKKQTHDMLAGIIQFRSKRVEEIMVPRVDMESIESEMPVNEIMALSLETGYSRFPVYEETVDHIIGVLSVKSIMKDYISSRNDIKAIKRIMMPYFVPEGKMVKDLFNEMQKKKIHMAVVIDEFGGTAGIVTLEDILEEIVGEIEDEHEKEVSNITTRGKKYIVKGNTTVDEINERLKLRIRNDEFQTVAGYILEKIGHIPKKNERFKLNGFMVKVRNMDDRRISELEFYRIKK